MSLLDDEDIDMPLHPGAISPGLSEPLGTVASNPLTFMDDDSMVPSDNFGGGGSMDLTGRSSTLPRTSQTEMVDPAPVKHSKLTKFIAGRKKGGSKGSFHAKKSSGPSPPLSPKTPAKAQAGADQSSKASKHQYSALRDSPDVPDDIAFRTSPIPPPPPQSGNLASNRSAPLFMAEPFSNSQQSSGSSVGDLGSELTSPISTTSTFSPTPAFTATSQAYQGLCRPGPRLSQTQAVSLLPQTAPSSVSTSSNVPARLPPPPQGQGAGLHSEEWGTSRPKPSSSGGGPVSSDSAVPSKHPSSDPWLAARTKSASEISAHTSFTPAAPHSTTTSTGTGGGGGGGTGAPVTAASGTASTSPDPWKSGGAGQPGSLSSAGVVNPQGGASGYDWSIAGDMRQKFVKQFNDLNPQQGQLKGEKARDFFVKSRLPNAELSLIWKLSDMNEDNALSEEEFCVAMKLVVARRKGITIPASLPEVLRPRPASAPVSTVPDVGLTERQDQDWARFSPTSTSAPSPVPSFPPPDASPRLPGPPQPARKAPPVPTASVGEGSDEIGQQHSASNPPSSSAPHRDRPSMKHQRSKSSFETTANSQFVIGAEKESRRRSDVPSNSEHIEELVGEESLRNSSQQGASREVRSSSTGQLVELDSQVVFPSFPTEPEGSGEEVLAEPIYTAVIKANKIKNRESKLVHFDYDGGVEGSGADVRTSVSTEGEAPASSPSAGKQEVKRKPKRPPPPVPTPFAEHRKKSTSPNPDLTPPPKEIPSHYETAPVVNTDTLVDFGEEDVMYEMVDAPLIAKIKSKSSAPAKPSAQPKPSVQPIAKPPHPAKSKHSATMRPSSREKKKKEEWRDVGVMLPGLERDGGEEGGHNEIGTVLEAMKARGHTRTSSLDSKKKEIASTAEYQNLVHNKPEYQNLIYHKSEGNQPSLVEGLPPANPPAVPPKPKKKDHLEEPARQSGGRILSRSASLDSINSLSSYTGTTATSPVPKQKSEWKEPPHVSPRTKKKPVPLKKPLPLPSSKDPIHPVRRATKLSESSHTPSKSSSTSSESQPGSKPLSRHQPVAAGGPDLEGAPQRPPSPARPPAKPAALSHGADVLSVAIAIAEKASVIPSASQVSGLRDKTVVQQAIRTLKEEISTLKSTNSELQSQFTMLMEERHRLRQRVSASAL